MTSITETSQIPPPTLYTVRSKESFEPSKWRPYTVVLVPLAAWATFDMKDQLEKYNALNITIAVVVLSILYQLVFSRTVRTKEVDLSLDILPLGIQRSKTTTTSYHNSKSNHSSVDYHPLLPIESVKDCILLEHVGAFSVSTHVMIRLKSKNNDNTYQPSNASKGLVEAFPGANLKFRECQQLVDQIQRALLEVQ